MFLNSVKFACLTMLLPVFAVPAHGQSAARRCADGRKLTLAAVEGYVTRKQDAIAIARIEGCHVGFSLDAAALQGLAHAGMSEPVFEALNLDTLSRMTVEQAHAEVAALDGKTVDAETQKIFQARIQFLKQAEYVVTEPFTRTQYTANQKLEEGKIGAVEYGFTPVTAEEDRAIAAKPADMVIVRHYEEDEAETRIMRVESAHIQVSGMSVAGMKRTVISKALKNMRQTLAEGDKYFQLHDAMAANTFYGMALQSADEVLTYLDSNNIEAKAGKQHATDRLAAIRAASGGRPGQPSTPSATVGQKDTPDAWVDPKTKLMWARKDNGRNVNWNVARDFCKTSAVGGFSDWRLASADELKGVYDRSTDPEISDWKQHIRGGIQLTGAVVWSGTRDNTTIFGEGAVWMKFSDGFAMPDAIGTKAGRALCVRGPVN